MYGYVYLTENLINGKCYIGQHRAEEFDENYKGSGCALSRAFDEYGRDNFISTIIEWCDTEKELSSREEYWIKKCNAIESPCFYNRLNSFKPGRGWHQSDETRARISESNKGKKLSNETRERISKSLLGKESYWKGKHLPDYYKERISETLTGRQLPEEHKKKIGAAFKGRTWKLVDGKRVWYDKT